MLNCLSEYGTSINKEQGHSFTTSNLKCLGDQTQSLCKLLQVNNQYLLGRLQWPQYHREPWSTKQYTVKQAPSLLQETFLCLCGKMSPSELSPQRREVVRGRGCTQHSREATLLNEPRAASSISLWQRRHGKWQALSGKVFILTRNAATPKQPSQRLSHQRRQEVTKREGYHWGRCSNRDCN